MYNPETVDLLIWVMYCSAAEGAIDRTAPVGMVLRVPPPDKVRITVTQPTPYQVHTNPNTAPASAPPLPTSYQTGTDGLVDFDMLPIEHMHASIVSDRYVAVGALSSFVLFLLRC
ncbi:hypothetical protein B0H17DRAFT_722141 [Mycena rosella]|uniref:Uncharacterized protein n=1 Tax=Mycena rosella TaxID=1033263 RepID=A0AAD7B4R5_MYCRO|nr:hypothetical protein B0H17DRAFT_722141 [Mycena rosella]